MVIKLWPPESRGGSETSLLVTSWQRLIFQVALQWGSHPDPCLWVFMPAGLQLWLGSAGELLNTLEFPFQSVWDGAQELVSLFFQAPQGTARVESFWSIYQ